METSELEINNNINLNTLQSYSTTTEWHEYLKKE